MRLHSGVLTWFALAGLPVALSGCEGPAGEAGADGADGADGANGQDGASGADGLDGADGADGADGSDGADGLDGWDAHQGEAPWGVHLDIFSVTGGTGANGAFQVGDFPIIEFSVTDDDGIPYRLDELSGLRILMSGPTDHYQIAVYYDQLTPVASSLWDSATQTYSFVFDTPIPAVYHAAPNDTADLDADNGDFSGLALEDGTYTVAAYAYEQITRTDGSTYYDAGNSTYNVLFGAATVIEDREVVLQENCASCHGDAVGLFQHGGARRDVTLCLTCHVDGAEDRYSAVDSSVTPGVTISMGQMIHKIHRGSGLANGFEVAGFPADPSGFGYPNYNLYDFSDITFPVFPDDDVSCASCHESAAQGDVTTHPTRDECGACHDTIVWSTGLNHEGGPQLSDANCTVCHLSSALQIIHDDPRLDPSINNTGLNVDLISIAPGTGPNGQLQVGDPITITYKLTDDFGATLLTSNLASMTAIFSGPIDHMQWIAESSTGHVAANSIANPDGTYTYTFLATVPATYPAQKNNTADIGLAEGDWFGQAVVDGTYRVALNGYKNVTAASGVVWREPSADVESVLLGATSTTVETRDVISQDNCLQCHVTMEFHGEGRQSTDYCVMCHTYGAEDRNSTATPTSTPKSTVAFPIMIHKIHMGKGLTKPYDVVGFGNIVSNFNEIGFPRFDGGVQECTACHGESEAWKQPSAIACTSCHDSDDTAAHAAINTDPVFGESCNVCHESGDTYAVDKMHDFLK